MYFQKYIYEGMKEEYMYFQVYIYDRIKGRIYVFSSIYLQ